MGAERYRHWIAALLSFLQPGLGHAYLRSWGRALLWFATWVGTIAVLVPVPPLPTALSDVVPFLAALTQSLNGVALGGSLALAAVTAFATMDAYWLAARRNHGQTSGSDPHCPNCGQELDRSLEFCPWCAEELDGWIRPPEEGDSERSEA